MMFTQIKLFSKNIAYIVLSCLVLSCCVTSCAPKQVPVSQIDDVANEQISDVSQTDDVTKEQVVSQTDEVAKKFAPVFVDNNPKCPVLAIPSFDTNPIPKEQQRPMILTLEPDETGKAKLWFEADVNYLYVVPCEYDEDHYPWECDEDEDEDENDDEDVDESIPNCPTSAAYALDFEVDCDGDGVYEQKYWRPSLTQDPSNTPECARGGSGVLSASGGACAVAMCEIDAQGIEALNAQRAFKTTVNNDEPQAKANLVRDAPRIDDCELRQTSPSQKRNTAHCLEAERVKNDGSELLSSISFVQQENLAMSSVLKERLAIVCEYQDQKPKRVAIRGDLPWVMFGDPSLSRAQVSGKPVIIEQWGDIRWKTAAYMFSGAHAEIRAKDSPNLHDVVDMTAMFSNFVTAGKSDIVLNWDVSNVLIMRRLLLETDFNPQIGSWNVSNVINMFEMFKGATSFNQPIGGWNTSKIMDMGSMFENATSFNQPIGGWNTSKVLFMNSMFSGATSFNQPIGTWNVSNVKTMAYMFSGAKAFNQPIGSWDVSNVVYMDGMFEGATSFNQPIVSWNVSKVEDMRYMFYGATSFNQPLDSWNVSKVLDMGGMFTGATSFNQPLDSWEELELKYQPTRFYRAYPAPPTGGK